MWCDFVESAVFYALVANTVLVSFVTGLLIFNLIKGFVS